MPLYEYVCRSCGYEFDVLQSFSDDPISICESCCKEDVVKKISLPSFSLKGGGWYKDHYGLKKSESTSTSNSTSKSESSSSSKGESSSTKSDSGTSSSSSD